VNHAWAKTVRGVDANLRLVLTKIDRIESRPICGGALSEKVIESSDHRSVVLLNDAATIARPLEAAHLLDCWADRIFRDNTY
jgi:hypothetical protein